MKTQPFLLVSLLLLALAATCHASTAPANVSSVQSAVYSFSAAKSALDIVRDVGGQAGSTLRYVGSPEFVVVEGRLRGTHAIRLSDGSYVGNPIPMSAAGFTATIWLNKRGQGSQTGNNGTRNATLIAVGNGYYDGWRLTTDNTNRTISFEIGRPQGSIGLTTPISVSDNQWRSITVVWNRRAMSIYVDGELACKVDYSGPYTAPQNPDGALHIGFNSNGVGSEVMDVDRAAFTNQALLPEEVLADSYPEQRLTAALSAEWCNANTELADRQNRRAELMYLDLLRSSAIAGIAAGSIQLNLGDSEAAQGKVLQASREYEKVFKSDMELRPQVTDRLFDLAIQGSGVPLPDPIYSTGLARTDITPDQRRELRLNYAISLAADGRYPEAYSQLSSIALDEYASPAWRMTGWLCRSRLDQKTGRAQQALVDDEQAKSEMAIAPLGPQIVGLSQRTLSNDRSIPGTVELPKLPIPGIVLWVSPSGKDGNSGAASSPLGSLLGARDRIRELKAAAVLPPGGVEVMVRGGIYPTQRTLELTPQDSGDAASPIVYSAAAGALPIFNAGRTLSKFKRITDPDILKILPIAGRTGALQCDLQALGITDYGTFNPGGNGSARGFYTHPLLQLYFGGVAMPLAGWPNPTENRGLIGINGPGHPTIVYGFAVMTPGAPAERDRVHYTGDEPQNWVNEPDAWLHGYFGYEWSDSYEKVASIDTVNKTITLAPPVTTYGNPPIVSGHRFRVVNALSELDSPGEWYLNRVTGILYFYPPSPSRSSIQISMMESPAVDMTGVSHVVFRGLEWKNGRADAVKAQSCNHCLFEGCTVRQFSGDGIDMNGGSDDGIVSCNINELGRGGIMMAGGDRKSLTPSGDFVQNCKIGPFSFIDHTYTPAISVDGVGMTITHNELFGGNSSALRVGGNDHLVEYNNIHDVVLESDDQGGSDMWGDPTFQGDVFLYNYWHDIGRQAGWMTAGVRLDDFISGVEIYGNVFDRCSDGGFGAVQINRGTDDVIENNLFYNCQKVVSGGSMSTSEWNTLKTQDFIKSRMDFVNASAPPYSVRYPALLHLGQVPITYIWNNVSFNCQSYIDDFNKQYVGNANLKSDPGFVDAAHGDFRLRIDAPLRKRLNFQPIPFDLIGTYSDSFRVNVRAQSD